MSGLEAPALRGLNVLANNAGVHNLPAPIEKANAARWPRILRFLTPTNHFQVILARIGGTSLDPWTDVGLTGCRYSESAL